MAILKTSKEDEDEVAVVSEEDKEDTELDRTFVGPAGERVNLLKLLNVTAGIIGNYAVLSFNHSFN